MSNKKALLVVDYQYDFVSDDGALTAGLPAQKIENNIYEKIKEYQNINIDIFFTKDTHYNNDWDQKLHPEYTMFNKHCIYGTKGYQLYGKIKQFENDENTFIKCSYCLECKEIDRLTNNYSAIEICGVVTDICVMQNTIALYNSYVNKGIIPNLKIDTNCCASFNAEREKQCLDYMKDIMGVIIKN